MQLFYSWQEKWVCPNCRGWAVSVGSTGHRVDRCSLVCHLSSFSCPASGTDEWTHLLSRQFIFKLFAEILKIGHSGYYHVLLTATRIWTATDLLPCLTWRRLSLAQTRWLKVCHMTSENWTTMALWFAHTGINKFKDCPKVPRGKWYALFSPSWEGS